MDSDAQHDESYKRQIYQYATFEDRGVSLLSRMLAFAPSEEEKGFLSEQVEDEKKHARIFGDLADALGIEEKFFNESLEQLYDIGQKCVDDKDWLACVTCQSVIEELAIASFSLFFQRADEKTRILLLEVIEDEKKHLAFALNQIKKWTKTNTDSKKIMQMQEKVLSLFMRALDPKHLNKRLKAEEHAHFKKILKSTYALHKQRFSSINIAVPDIPTMLKKHLT